MEIVAMDMKLRGMYIARQLSFQGVTFKIDEVPLTQNYIKMYNKSVRLVCIYVYFTVSSLTLFIKQSVVYIHFWCDASQWKFSYHLFSNV